MTPVLDTLLDTKLFITLGLAAGLPVAAGLSIQHQMAAPQEPAAATVTIAPRDFSYRMAGDFTRAGAVADAPLTQHRLGKSITIMKSQVTAAAYDECVQARACRPLTQVQPPRPDVPVVGVSWEDATAYARWLSAKTGEVWRLPTSAEWSFAAGSRARTETIAAEGRDFSERWIAKYEQESERERTADRTPRPIGSFGANENGLFDLAGNVWEWTDTCFTRQAIDAQNKPVGPATVNCGVRLVEGQHRTYVTNFIRDARGGGCSVGAPPTNLGFRLVREDTRLIDRLMAGLRRMAAPFSRLA